MLRQRSSTVGDQSALLLKGTSTGLGARLSNPTTLRAPTRSSVVTYNAFQKVFKVRFDESRAHIHAGLYANVAPRRPFISDISVPYSGLLGKNRNSFFTAPTYALSPHRLYTLLPTAPVPSNVPMYGFPFLLSGVSDPARFA